MRPVALLASVAAAACLLAPADAAASSILYNNDVALNSMASASTPAGNGFIERESADDFVLMSAASVESATFTGLVPTGATISQVVVEMYRVFPDDSTVPPDGRVPTRVNSPSDVAFASRDSSLGELNFTTVTLANDFTAANSVINGIHPIPNFQTSGEGPARGQEVQFDVTFTTPIGLPADHYFFVPQVLLSGSSVPFLWLSAARPATLTPFAPDLQSWIRDGNLDPDWLRIGTDIVGATTFNAAFSISGSVTGTDTVPEPGTLTLLALGGAGVLRRRSRPHTGRE